MEEKERYIINRFDKYINITKKEYYPSNQTICKIINQQDKENQQLKQQLHDLPKKIVEEIRDDMSKRIMEKQIKCGDNIQIGFICNAINECLDTILKQFGDKNESNND